MTLLGMEISALISLAVTLTGLMFTYRAHKRTMKKDAEESARANAVLLAEVQQIKEGTVDMRDQFREVREQMHGCGERLAAIEASLLIMDRRIDKLERRAGG